MRLELVSSWMTRDVITISPETTLPEAARLMADRNIRRLPVVENGRLAGIITYGDVREAGPSSANAVSVGEIQQRLSTLAVSSIMTRNPVFIAYNATLGEAAQLMLQKSIGGLPVVDEKKNLVGIITESDIFRMVVRDWERQRQENEDDIEPYAHYG